MGDGRTDPFLTAAVVRRGVDEVDAGVQGGIQHTLGLLVRDLRAGGGAAQLHRPVAEAGHFEAPPAKRAARQRRHLWLPPNALPASLTQFVQEPEWPLGLIGDLSSG